MIEKSLLFIGDSLVEFCDWQVRFPEYKVVNLGRSGETVQELKERVPAVLRRHEPPTWLLVMSGINNVAREDYGFLPAYEELLERLRAAWPETVLTVNSLLPVRLPWVAPDLLPRTNSMLRAMAARQQALFLDAHDHLLDGQGLADRRYLMDDGVHLSAAGYARWTELVAAEVDRL
jgi:lysophospholipase L1-like esterase